MAEIVRPVDGPEYLELDANDILNVIDALRIAEVVLFTLSQDELVKKKMRKLSLAISAQFGELAAEIADWEARD